MTQEELCIRIICLEKSLKKANYRIFLLEKKKNLHEETKKIIELRKKTASMIQLDLLNKEMCV